MNKDDAEEYTQSLGQIVGGSWRQIALAKRLGVPKALGLEVEEWVNQRLGGYVQLSITDMREAAIELKAEGQSTREIASVLGASKSAVGRAIAVPNGTDSSRESAKTEAATTAAVPNGTLEENDDDASDSAAPLSVVAALAVTDQVRIAASGSETQILQSAKEIRATKADQRREERIGLVAAMAAPSPELPTQRYAVIYADPPWRYEFSTDDRAIENQYPTMEIEDICAMNVADMATDDAILFIWATSPKLPEAMSVITAWGFTYRSSAVWVKPQLGMGYYFRQQHELLLVATRGSIPAPAPADRLRSVVTADRTAHSAKPAEFAEAIERMYPTLPKIELFCRTGLRGGWATWGNQNAA